MADIIGQMLEATGASLRGASKHGESDIVIAVDRVAGDLDLSDPKDLAKFVKNLEYLINLVNHEGGHTQGSTHSKEGIMRNGGVAPGDGISEFSEESENWIEYHLLQQGVLNPLREGEAGDAERIAREWRESHSLGIRIR